VLAWVGLEAGWLPQCRVDKTAPEEQIRSIESDQVYCWTWAKFTARR